MKNYITLILLVIATLFTAGCDRESGTLGGGAVGTAFGAAMGNAMGGGSAGGTALGAVIGGLTGAAIGNDIGAQEEAARDDFRNAEPVCVPQKKVVYYERSAPTRVVHQERVIYKDNGKQYRRAIRDQERRIRELEDDLMYERHMNACEPAVCVPEPVYCETYCSY